MTEQEMRERQATAQLLRRRPKGECAYCDKYGDEAMMPSHTASEMCESGKHPHCICSTCF